MKYSILVICITLLQSIATGQTVEERLKSLEERAENAEGAVTRLREEYDKKLGDAAKLIDNMKKDQEKAKKDLEDAQKKATGDLGNGQKQFQDLVNQTIVPVGSIIPYYGRTIDLSSNWRLCDGRTVTNEPQSVYNNKSVPDLRGRFLRSVVSYTDPIGTIGGTDEIPGHSHSVEAVVENIEMPKNKIMSGIILQAPSQAHAFYPDKYTLTTTPEGSEGHGHFGGSGSFYTTSSYESKKDNRPAYYTVYYIIRIK